MMTVRLVLAALLAPLVFARPPAAAAEVVPQPGVLLTGAIKFPREQGMSMTTDPRDGSKLTVRLGFDGKCKGGGLGETWASHIQTTPTLQVRNGRFAETLHGTAREIGGMKGHTGVFTWRFAGRFTTPTDVVGTVSGSLRIKRGSKVVARCKIARPAAVRLTSSS